MPNNRAFKSGQASLLRAHHLNQVKSRLLGVVTTPYAKGEVESGLEIMTGIELLFSDGIGRFLGSIPPQSHDLHNTQGGLQSEFHVFPVEELFHVSRLRLRITEE